MSAQELLARILRDTRTHLASDSHAHKVLCTASMHSLVFGSGTLHMQIAAHEQAHYVFKHTYFTCIRTIQGLQKKLYPIAHQFYYIRSYVRMCISIYP